MIIIEEIREQRAQLFTQPITSNIVSVNPSSQLYEIPIETKKFNGTTDENIIIWLTYLEAIMRTRLITDHERISVAVSLLGGTALQWFVSLILKQQRPDSWSEF
ncbi:unnamed protein product [Adineta steineri]|uniref:DUF4939 domain-containing protein n=1 Tax=Adineta steineri TaxID=433720 RepID=A0A815VKV2_9BILA|nr:unnamed protein product [Adineta steineri]